MEVSGELHTTRRFIPGETAPRTYCGPQSRSGRYGQEKISCPYRDSNPSSFVVKPAV
jgi:hypothetical protein